MDLRYTTSSQANQPIIHIGQPGTQSTTITPQKILAPLQGIGNSVGVNQAKYPISYRKDENQFGQSLRGENYLGENSNDGQYRSYIGSSNTTSPNVVLKKFDREQDDVQKLSLEEINRELDANMNEIIVLLNKRKHLIIVKRQKLKDEFKDQLDFFKRATPEELVREIGRNEGSTEGLSNFENLVLQKIANSSDSFSKMKKVVQSVARDLSSNLQEKQRLEVNRSADFWNTNKNFEDEVDNHLQKLKFYDSELEKTNYQIQEVCKNLDSMEEQIKILLLAKDDDHVRRAEPVFNQKQRLHEQLNIINSQRNKIKDEKIGIITRIIDYLTDLKQLREERLRDLSGVFGVDDNQSDSASKIQLYVEFAESLENLAKIKDNLHQTEIQEEGIQSSIDRLFKENDQLFAELIKKQSEEAKAYAELADNYQARLNIQRAIELFMSSANLQNVGTLDVRDLLKRFKDNIIFLKPLVEEDQALRQGLSKTFETIHSFSNMLLAIETEKERRKELVSRLEQCIRLKGEGDLKTEDLRNVEMEATKKGQQKKNMEEDIDNILSEADLEEYKRVGIQMKQIDREAEELGIKRNRYQQEVDQIQQQVKFGFKIFIQLYSFIQVVQRINQIRSDYDDILKEVISNDVMNKYDFKNSNDIKSVKNLLKKTFKRLGMNFEESKMI